MPKTPKKSPPAETPSPFIAKKPTAPATAALLDDDELEPEILDEEELDEEEKTDEEKEAAIPSAEEEVDKGEEKEEEIVDEEAILAKGDELEILNLLAKKVNRMEQGLDDDELVPDEEGMGGF
jgi:hypothetical protein